jgi:hypothetical protein
MNTLIIELTYQEDHIGSRHLWKSEYRQTVFKYFPFCGVHTSEDLFNSGLSLPSEGNLIPENFASIV